MAASRLKRAAGFGTAAAAGLLAAVLCSGCGLQREFVRRGQVLDSMSVRLMRVEQTQQRQEQEIARLRAGVLTELENIDGRIDQLDARVVDLGDRLDRISRRVGAGRGDITPTAPDSLSAARPDSAKSAAARPVPDTAGLAADQLYNTAYLDFTRGKYDVAIGEFRRYLASASGSDNADNAQYWIGESFYSLGKLDSAEAGFRQVMADFPKGNKVPAAEYKLGLVYLAQNRKAAATNQLRRVVKEYPGSNEAKLAQERLQTLGQ
ncbi:tol-pal system protein YbgF [candidate division WOR-3 bacterium]|uniref:Tol-pal system protein YbgF n=1 Tax=candidate division WOR-3 bacterium TaxID=2052148 RepID=A0A938BQM4_UNCW3|nr:tol-pal system protein YbgF [candidate division WOR-3 bacterium]